jgi:hypothetical protein
MTGGKRLINLNRIENDRPPKRALQYQQVGYGDIGRTSEDVY